MTFDFKRMLKYERNVGDRDQNIRYGTGSLAIVISLFLGSVPLLLLGIALLASGYTHFCPLYAGMGRTTAGSCCGGKAKTAQEGGHSCCGGDKPQAHQH
ncbi:MAG: YgaP family membrane protein [Methylohalobius sp. ZOD2]